MKLVDMWRDAKRPTVSFELFPAPSEKAAGRLAKAIAKLASAEPDFFSVTFGAGGSTRTGSYELVKKLKEEFGAKVLAYVSGYGLAPASVSDVVRVYAELGIEDVLLVRGDKPEGTDGADLLPDSFVHASDMLLALAANSSQSYGAACYPEGHNEASSLEADLASVRIKLDSGAQFLVANYFYDNEYFFEFVDKARGAGIDVPILPGIMPVFSAKMTQKLAALCGATITEELKSGLAGLPADDKDALAEFGIDFAYRQCVELIEKGVVGLHFYTMNKSRASFAIVKRLREEGHL